MKNLKTATLAAVLAAVLAGLLLSMPALAAPDDERQRIYGEVVEIVEGENVDATCARPFAISYLALRSGELGVIYVAPDGRIFSDIPVFLRSDIPAAEVLAEYDRVCEDILDAYIDAVTEALANS